MDSSFGFVISTILPVDVEIGRSSLAGVAIFANMSENPAALFVAPFFSSVGASVIIGSSFGGGAGLAGGGAGRDGGAGLDGG